MSVLPYDYSGRDGEIGNSKCVVFTETMRQINQNIENVLA